LFALVRHVSEPALPSNEAFAQSLRLKLKDSDAPRRGRGNRWPLVGYIAGDAHETFYAGGKIAWVDEIPGRRERAAAAASAARDDGVRELGGGGAAGSSAWRRKRRLLLCKLGFEPGDGYFKRYLKPATARKARV
jgi:hypothetical protein